ncbi:SubName: Full=Uncharacterized protein {ECO:0000313/EMBL:CCA74793.1} [Serendipita indica DSM 11827]|uniref:DFDF domain-containing protein n=1 Tax=Serendipita indica (strain DSM 11827) TaxID=1109443 RepID=G4TU00_SERID|nr:SubName: Full=Uncharacterized protein {ECO:0000313/EMBL:CCA74793.1} [Serendipita indica DSM 11827]CCA74793.1 hypothetical protein PIIN_08762 [Serendipita indica DSM 11827]
MGTNSKTCRIISKQNIRYSGIMLSIDAVAQKIRVTDVRCYGTEDRPTDMFVPPMAHSFGLIEFNVSDLSDLKFEDPIPAPEPQTAPPPSAAVANPPVAPPQQTQYQQRPMQDNKPVQQQQPAAPPTAPAANFSAEKAMPPGFSGHQLPNQQQASVNASQPPRQQQNNTDSLTRSMGAMKINNGQHGGPSPTGGQATGSAPQQGGRGQSNRRGRGGRPNGTHHGQHQRADLKIPSTDFDFEAANNRFDKSAATKHHQLLQGTTPPTVNEETPEEPKSADTKEDKGYNPTKSFFDNLSSDLTAKKPSNRGGTAGRGAGEEGAGGRGRGRGRARREEEREKNVETFGEPGGVGLMGPGAYIGGYGGQRGKRRRGAPRGGGRGGGAPRVTAQNS